ncbi:hypothetical protein D3C86_1101900 [compost metagenome]
MVEGGLGLAEQLPHQVRKGLGDSGVRHVVPILVELPLQEVAMVLAHGHFEGAGQGGLPGTGRSFDEHQLSRAGRRRPEAGVKGADFALSAVQPLGAAQRPRPVAVCQEEGGDAAGRLPLVATQGQIAHQPEGALIALVRVLGEQLHDHVAERRRQGRVRRVRRKGHPRQVAVHPLQRVRGREGQRAGQQPVECDAQRVEVAPAVRPVPRATRLLGGDEGEGPEAGLRRRFAFALAGRLFGQIQVGEADLLVLRRPEDALGREGQVNDVAMEPREGMGAGDRQGEEVIERQALARSQ